MATAGRVCHVGPCQGQQASPALSLMRAPSVAGLRMWRRSRHAPTAPQAVVGSQMPEVAPRNMDDRSPKDDMEAKYLKKRSDHVTTHFETALGVDDFMQRLEQALWGFGFQNDNSIACVNLCRDEITHTLKHKIDQVFGSSFNTNGLGGVLTCGVTGMGAGLSHSPASEASGKERYVFFSFPHIAIDAEGVVGNVSRPGRAAMSCACGAVIKALGDIKKDGLACSCGKPGEHDPEDPEFSVLKQRLARRLDSEGHTESSLEALDLVQLTKVAERSITSDLEGLIAQAVDTSKADYAVVTGIQIHNWGVQFDDNHPNLEFVAPTSVYAVVNGKKIDINLTRIPALTPRQIRLLANAPDAHVPTPADMEQMVCNSGGRSVLREIDPPYMYNSREARNKIKARLESFAKAVKPAEAAGQWTAADDAMVNEASSAQNGAPSVPEPMAEGQSPAESHVTAQSEEPKSKPGEGEAKGESQPKSKSKGKGKGKGKSKADESDKVLKA